MAQPTPHRDVQVRRVRFDYQAGGRREHFVKGENRRSVRDDRGVEGDLVMSHAVAVLSGMFPEGEDYFVRSVRAHRDLLDDPELKKQVAGFIGQEVTHGREHRDLNETLASMGYRSMKVDRHVKRLLSVLYRRLPKKVSLAVTAALEHYTATLAEVLLTDPDAQRLLGETEVRSLLLWHALEESEHKAVAFDVYRAAGGKEWLRIHVMRATTAIFILEVVWHTFLSLLRDRDTYRLPTLVRSLSALRRSPFLQRPVLAKIRSYNKAGFHPDDWDATEVLTYWRGELFGPDGVLADHLR